MLEGIVSHSRSPGVLRAPLFPGTSLQPGSRRRRSAVRHFALAAGSNVAAAQTREGGKAMTEVQKVSPSEVRRARSGSDDEVLLVCAWADPEKCRKLHLDGSLSLDEFKNRFNDPLKDLRIAFYCN
jgi:hypothetical protein